MRAWACVVVVGVLLSGCGSNDSDSGTTASPGTTTQAVVLAPTAKDAGRWARVWCTLKPGESRDAIVRAMGAPTEQQLDSTSWDGFGYHLAVFYDTRSRARQLDVNAGSVGCATTRKLS